MTEPRILCVGALTRDLTFRVAKHGGSGGKTLAHDLSESTAGMASSAATAAQRQGGRVWLWASVGADASGEQLVSDMQADGIDCAFVRRVADGASATAANVVEDDGERTVVVYYDPITMAAPGVLPFPDATTFDATLVDTRWPAAAALALDAAQRSGRPAILDADTAPETVLRDLLPRATHIVASEPAAKAIAGDAATPAEAARRLADRYPVHVAVTAGGAGTFWTDPQTGNLFHTPAPRIEVVETLVAGDVFHGTYAYEIAAGSNLETAIATATVAAAIKCQRFGGRKSAPARPEVLEWLTTRGAPKAEPVQA